MTETAAAARFQVLDGPHQLPGVCSCCGSPSKRVVDFGKKIERYGRIYICVECISDAGRTVGLVDRDAVESANNRVIILEAELATYKAASENFDDHDELNTRLVGGLIRALSHPSVVGALKSVVEAATAVPGFAGLDLVDFGTIEAESGEARVIPFVPLNSDDSTSGD